MRHSLRLHPNISSFSAATALALCLAAPAEAANAGKHKKPVASATAHPTKHRRTASTAQPPFRYQGGVPVGPLYNGQDYLGNDPDPNIRSQILRDMGGRYGGND
jgi:hypothetical protein